MKRTTNETARLRSQMYLRLLFGQSGLALGLLSAETSRSSGQADLSDGLLCQAHPSSTLGSAGHLEAVV